METFLFSLTHLMAYFRVELLSIQHDDITLVKHLAKNIPKKKKSICKKSAPKIKAYIYTVSFMYMSKKKHPNQCTTPVTFSKNIHFRLNYAFIRFQGSMARGGQRSWVLHVLLNISATNNCLSRNSHDTIWHKLNKMKWWNWWHLISKLRKVSLTVTS